MLENFGRSLWMSLFIATSVRSLQTQLKQMFLPNISETWMLHKEKMSDLPISMQNTNAYFMFVRGFENFLNLIGSQ